MRILVLNGPNLNRLGKREPEIYGSASLGDLESELADAFPDVRFQFSQSNHEGELIESLHAAGDEKLDGVVFNPGGFSHTSVALRDAMASIDVPIVEVHITNVHAREAFRHTSVTAGAAAGVIAGLGLRGYHLAVRFLLDTRS
jgi:3-dehydroquinate dehydratase II